MKPKDAYLVGYYGMKNSGDDALLLASAWAAKKYLNINNFCVNSYSDITVNKIGRFKKTVSEHQLIKGQNRISQYWQSLSSQQVLFGGGSVLHSERDINVMRKMMSLSGAGPHRAMGVSLGPFKNSKAESSCKKFLQACDFIGLRDKESVEIARYLTPDKQVELTFDLAPILLDIPNISKIHNPLPGKGIAVALCPKERLVGNNSAENTRINKLASVLVECYKQTGEPIYLVDLNGHEYLGDEVVHAQLRALIPDNVPVFHIAYNSDPINVLKVLSQFKVVIAMRLHASILAYLVNTPVISLNYHNKCKGWCEQIGMYKAYQFDASLFDKYQLLETLLNGLQYGFIPSTLSHENAISAAKCNFKNVVNDFRGVLCQR